MIFAMPCVDMNNKRFSYRTLLNKKHVKLFSDKIYYLNYI